MQSAEKPRLLTRLRAIFKDPRSRKQAIAAALGFAIMAAVWGPAWLSLFRLSLDPLYCNDDARVQIYPFMRYQETGLFPHDYVGDYVLATLGWGYRLLYMLGAKLGDVRTMSKLVPYALFGLTAGALAWAASRWARLAGALVAIALCLSSEVFIERMAGGLPRGFGFAIAAWAAAALVHGRMMLLAAVTCLGAAFYSAAAVPPGMALAAVLLLFPARHRGSAADWSLKKRLAVVGGTAALSVVLLVPTAVSLRPYGSYIRPANVDEYPEAGVGGRFYHGDRPPYKSFFTTLAEEAPKPLLGGGKRLSPLTEDKAATRDEERQTRHGFAYILLGLAAAGFVSMTWRSSGAKRLCALAGSAVVGFFVSYQVVPYMYLPQRYLAYPAPVLTTIFVATAGVGLFGAFARASRRTWMKSAVVLGFGLACLLLTGGAGNPKIGINTTVSGSRLYPFLGTLPKDALIAGWPSGAMDNVSYFGERRVLVTFECHLPFNKGYTDEMRRRTEALFKAYFASEPEPLIALRERFGVTHLLVDTRHYGGHAPSYFRPFDRLAAQEHAAGSRKGFLVPKLIERASVFKEGHYVVLDLSRLSTDGRTASVDVPAER